MKRLLFLIVFTIFFINSFAFAGAIGRQDFHGWDGISTDKTFTRQTTGGYTITLSDIGHIVDVLMAYGGGVNYTRDTIYDAITAINSGVSNNVGIVLDPGTWVIDSNVTITSNFLTILPSGVTIKPNTGITMYIQGPVDIGNYPVFDVSASGSSVVLTGPAIEGIVYDRWFTDSGTANIGINRKPRSAYKLDVTGGIGLYVDDNHNDYALSIDSDETDLSNFAVNISGYVPMRIQQDIVGGQGLSVTRDNGAESNALVSFSNVNASDGEATLLLRNAGVGPHIATSSTDEDLRINPNGTGKVSFESGVSAEWILSGTSTITFTDATYVTGGVTLTQNNRGALIIFDVTSGVSSQIWMPDLGASALGDKYTIAKIGRSGLSIYPYNGSQFIVDSAVGTPYGTNATGTSTYASVELIALSGVTWTRPNSGTWEN